MPKNIVDLGFDVPKVKSETDQVADQLQRILNLGEQIKNSKLTFTGFETGVGAFKKEVDNVMQAQQQLSKESVAYTKVIQEQTKAQILASKAIQAEEQAKLAALKTEQQSIKTTDAKTKAIEKQNKALKDQADIPFTSNVAADGSIIQPDQGKTSGPIVSDAERQALEEQIAATEAYTVEQEALAAANKQVVKTAEQLRIEEELDAKIKVEERLLNQKRIADLKNLIKEENAEKGSLEQRRLALIRLTNQYAALSAAERESPAGQRLAKITSDLNVQVKQLEKNVGVTGRNVGNYQEDIEKAAKSTGGFAGAIGKAFSGLRNIAYIIPGLGIAGIFSLAFDAISAFVTKLIDGNDKINTFAENLKNINEVVSNANKDAGKQIADLKILYTAATDVALADRDRADAAIELQKTYPETFKNFSIEEIELGKAKVGYDELTKSIIATARAKAAKDKIDQLEAQRLDVAFEKQKIQGTTDAEKKRAKGFTDVVGQDAIINTSKEEEQAQIEARRVKAFREQDLKDASLLEQEKFLIAFVGEANITKEVEKNLNKQGAASKKLTDYIFELNKLLLEDEAKTQEELSKNSLISFPQRNEAAKKANDARIALIDLTAAHEKQQEGVTADQIKLIDAQKYIALRDNAFKYSTDLQAIIADRLKIQEALSKEEQKILDEATAYFEADAKRRKEIAESEKPDFTGLVKDEIDSYKNALDDKLTIYATNKAKEEKILNEKHSNGKISEEKYQQEILKLQNKYAALTLKAQIEAAKAQLALLDPNSNQADKLKQAIAEADAALAKLGDTGKSTGSELEKTFQQINELAHTFGDLLSSYAEIGFVKEKNALQELEDIRQKNYENEVERVTNSTLTEEEKANKLKILEATRQAQKEENDRKERQIEVKRAKLQKAINIATLITETALAVVHQATSGDPYTAFARAFAVGALGAAKIAIAIATPIPTYAEGLKNNKAAHYGIYGEAGAELIEKPGQKPFIADKATLDFLPAGTSITPIDNDSLNHAMQNAMYKKTVEVLGLSAGVNRQQQANSDKMVNAIVTGMAKNKPSVSVKTQTTAVIDLGWAKYVAKNIKGRSKL